MRRLIDGNRTLSAKRMAHSGKENEKIKTAENGNEEENQGCLTVISYRSLRYAPCSMRFATF
jgi:hypothetical protein